MAVQIRWADAQGVKPWPKLVMASTTGAVWLGEKPARKALLVRGANGTPATAVLREAQTPRAWVGRQEDFAGAHLGGFVVATRSSATEELAEEAGAAATAFAVDEALGF